MRVDHEPSPISSSAVRASASSAKSRKWMTCRGLERSAPRIASCRSASRSASSGDFGGRW